MVQEIITYIVVALAVIIAIRKMTEGVVRKTKKGHPGTAKINGRGAACGIDCSDCTSKCDLYRECRKDII
jgi:hypothetical protein